MKTTGPTETDSTPAVTEKNIITAEKKQYAKFTLLITYTYRVAQIKGKAKQTYRDDLVELEFFNRKIKTEGLHPIEILHRKFLEEKLAAYSAIIFDNSKPQHNAVVFKVIIDKGRVKQFEDKRGEYYDLETGCSFAHLLDKRLTA